MAFSVNTNSSSLAALQTLNSTTRQLNQAQVRINTGFKVNTAKDNASTFAIAQGMRGDIAGLKSVQESLSLGGSTVNVALTAATKISDILNQMKDKVIQGQVPNVDRGKIQADIESFKQQITDIASAAQFNGVNLMTDPTVTLSVTASLNRTAASGAGSLTAMQIDVQAQDVTAAGLNVDGVSITGNNSVTFTPGPTATYVDDDTFVLHMNNGETHTFEFVAAAGSTLTSVVTPTDHVYEVVYAPGDSNAAKLGKMFEAMRDAGFSVTNNEDGSFTVTASTAFEETAPTTGATLATGTVAVAAPGPDPAAQIDTIEMAINGINSFLADLGVAANRLEIQGDFVKALTDTLTEGVGTLVDADLAAESATLQALQTKQQLGIQALSIANQQSGAVLALFRGG
jgi:flagellin